MTASPDQSPPGGAQEEGTTGRPVLWAATLRTVPVLERAGAVAGAGYAQMSAFPLDLRAVERSGTPLAEVRARLQDAGVRISVLDPLTQWIPGWAPPPGYTAADLDFVDFDADEAFRLGDAVGIESLSVIESFGQVPPHDLAVESFAAICDRAAEHGWRVHLEFIPHTAFPDLATAWDVVRDADRPNGGLVFDIWHYLRGDRDDALLSTIPGDRIHRVQVADGRHDLVGDFWNDLLHHRLTPGTGDLDLVGVLTLLRSIGALSSVGPEIFSDAYDAMPPDRAVRAARDSVDELLTRRHDHPLTKESP